MEEYINLQNFPINTHSEMDVISDYTQILEEGEMKQLLEVIRSSAVSLGYSANDRFWEKIWKNINLIRLYCQSHVENIETFRNLNGYTYFSRIVEVMDLHFTRYFNPNFAREVASMAVCKEILRIFDMISLTSSDMVGENSMGSDAIKRLINILWFVYIYNRDCVNIVTLVLRLYSKIFDELAEDTMRAIGRQDYLNALASLGPVTAAEDKFMFTVTTVAKNILSEDLNHGITILLRAFLVEAKINNINAYARSIVDAVILCMSREIKTPDKRGICDGQIRESQAQRRYNSEALTKGLRLITAIISQGGPLADALQDMQIVKEIVDKLKMHLTFVCEKGCNSSCCVHILTALLVLELLHSVFGREGALSAGIDPVAIFSEIVERAISKNSEFRFEDLRYNLPWPCLEFYMQHFDPSPARSLAPWSRRCYYYNLRRKQQQRR